MRKSTDRILTTHVGSLPAPRDVSLTSASADLNRVLRGSVAKSSDSSRTGRNSTSFITQPWRRHTVGADANGPQQVTTQARLDWDCTGPITYCGQDAVRRETDTLRKPIGDTEAADAFLTSTAPASLEPGRQNRYYNSEEEFVFLAEAMSVEHHRSLTPAFCFRSMMRGWRPSGTESA